MESFFASLEMEDVHHVRFRTRAEARAAVFDYVEVFYNRQRLHSALGYRTPAEARAGMAGITMLRPKSRRRKRHMPRKGFRPEEITAPKVGRARWEPLSATA